MRSSKYAIVASLIFVVFIGLLILSTLYDVFYYINGSIVGLFIVEKSGKLARWLLSEKEIDEKN